MVPKADRGAHADAVQLLGSAEDAEEGLVDQGTRPQEEAAVDRAAGDFDKGLLSGNEANRSAHTLYKDGKRSRLLAHFGHPSWFFPPNEGKGWRKLGGERDVDSEGCQRSIEIGGAWRSGWHPTPIGTFRGSRCSGEKSIETPRVRQPSHESECLSTEGLKASPETRDTSGPWIEVAVVHQVRAKTKDTANRELLLNLACSAPRQRGYQF